MSVLIRGKKMPQGCQKCTFLRKSYFECSPEYHYSCILGAKKIPIPWYYQLHNRAPDCPLVEIPPHGRLIDADELIKNCEIWEETEIQDEHDDVWNRGIDACINEIKHHAPTVIESEEEE